jgi:hypothetical protein
MDYSKINEQVLGPTDRMQVAEIIGRDKDEVINGNLWHYIVTIGIEKKFVLYMASGNSDLLKFKSGSFITLLKSQKDFSFCSLLFISTLYPLLIPETYDYKMQRSIDNRIPKKIKSLLLAGNGYMVYYHQLEIIYATLTNSSHAESVMFRRDWNLKKDYTRSTAKSIYIYNDLSLYEFIARYAINENMFFYQANYHGAYNLHNYINHIA